MTRPDGFAIADHDVGYFADDRVLDAVEAAGPLAALGYLAVRDLSWARGERVTFTTAKRRLSPLYGLSDEVLPALQAVGLLDADGRIPGSTWASWYDVAEARRTIRRERGRRGGLAKAANRAASTSSDDLNGESNTPSARATAQAVPKYKHKSARALPDRPSVVALRATDESVDSSGATPPAPEEEAGGVAPVASSPSVEVYCQAYAAHQSSHRRVYYSATGNAPWVCDICGPRPQKSFKEQMAAQHGAPSWAKGED